MAAFKAAISFDDADQTCGDENPFEFPALVAGSEVSRTSGDEVA